MKKIFIALLFSFVSLSAVGGVIDDAKAVLVTSGLKASLSSANEERVGVSIPVYSYEQGEIIANLYVAVHTDTLLDGGKVVIDDIDFKSVGFGDKLKLDDKYLQLQTKNVYGEVYGTFLFSQRVFKTFEAKKLFYSKLIKNRAFDIYMGGSKYKVIAVDYTKSLKSGVNEIKQTI